MALTDITSWMDEFGRLGAIWFVKRLSANDTLATNSHQAGPYIPKDFLFRIFPELYKPQTDNPDHHFDLYVDSHADHKRIRAVWYNNALRSGTRNETRLTGFGGQQSALLNPESTGALTVFAFIPDSKKTEMECHVWVCGGEGTEADLFEERLGPVEPKQYVIWTPGLSAPQASLFQEQQKQRTSCSLAIAEIPPGWLQEFPSGQEIIGKTIEMCSLKNMNVDIRMLRRRRCEYELFLSVEEAVYLPKITEGFSTIEGFISLAQTVLQSRKARSGNSLELHTKEIFIEEALIVETDFSYKPIIEKGKRPDFVFPSKAAYENPSFPHSKLRMLAAKTTCKDRWRQILTEADRVKTKHLLTLQEGVSEGQFREMSDAGVQLVVPAGLQDSYPETVRPHLMTLESFIADVRLLNMR